MASHDIDESIHVRCRQHKHTKRTVWTYLQPAFISKVCPSVFSSTSALKSTSSLAAAERLGKSIFLSPGQSELLFQNPSTAQPTCEVLKNREVLPDLAWNSSCIGFNAIRLNKARLKELMDGEAFIFTGRACQLGFPKSVYRHNNYFILKTSSMQQAIASGNFWLDECHGNKAQPRKQQLHFKAESHALPSFGDIWMPLPFSVASAPYSRSTFTAGTFPFWQA